MHLALALLLLVPALAVADPEAPTTVTVPVTLDAAQAATLHAWCAVVAAREGRTVPPQEQARALLAEKLAEIEALTLRAEAQRQADEALRTKAAETSATTRAWWRALRAKAAAALAQQNTVTVKGARP